MYFHIKGRAEVVIEVVPENENCPGCEELVNTVSKLNGHEVKHYPPVMVKMNMSDGSRISRMLHQNKECIRRFVSEMAKKHEIKYNSQIQDILGNLGIDVEQLVYDNFDEINKWGF